MKAIYLPIYKSNILQVLAMIAVKMKMCRPKDNFETISVVVHKMTNTYCVINGNKADYFSYCSIDVNEHLCSFISYSNPMNGFSLVAKMLLKLIPYHTHSSLSSPDVLILKVDFSASPHKMLVQFNEEDAISYNPLNILQLN